MRMQQPCLQGEEGLHQQMIQILKLTGRDQLGDGTTIQRRTPVAVTGLGSGVRAIAAANLHTCALTSAGAVLCWGDNSRGQLGDGTTTQRLTPVPVAGLGSGVRAISAGGDHTCAVTTAGAVFCWGDNIAGQVGDGTRAQRNTPVAGVGREQRGAVDRSWLLPFLRVEHCWRGVLLGL